MPYNNAKIYKRRFANFVRNQAQFKLKFRQKFKQNATTRINDETNAFIFWQTFELKARRIQAFSAFFWLYFCAF